MRGTLAFFVLLVGCGGSEEPATGTLPDAGSETSSDASPEVGAEAGISAKDRCAAVADSVAAAGFAAAVKVTCDAQYAWISADTYPDHVKMNGITGTNDQVPVPAPGYASPVTLSPKRAAKPTSIDAALAIAVNGVPIYDYSSQGTIEVGAYDPKFDTKLTGELDLCNGHSGRGDDYHYHAAPVCMMAAMKNKGPSAIVGWAFDGYPIYGNENPDGTAIAKGELDICNGKTDATFGYRYHTSDAPPYVIQCLSGEFDMTKAPRVPPLSGKPPGNKPPGGVTNLELVENPDGSRVMTYDHMGTSYSIAYKPSTTAGCWDFEEKSYTTGGVVKKNTYCRTAK